MNLATSPIRPPGWLSRAAHQPECRILRRDSLLLVAKQIGRGHSNVIHAHPNPIHSADVSGTYRHEHHDNQQDQWNTDKAPRQK